MFRFTIRELVLVTVIVAMGVGWWIDRTNSIRASESKAEFWKQCAIEFQGKLESDGYSVEVGHEHGITIIDPAGLHFYRAGETGRGAIKIDPSEPWPRANVLAGRDL